VSDSQLNRPPFDDEPTAIHMRSGGPTTPLGSGRSAGRDDLPPPLPDLPSGVPSGIPYGGSPGSQRSARPSPYDGDPTRVGRSGPSSRPIAAGRSQPETNAELRIYQLPLSGSANPYLSAAAPLLDLIVELSAAQGHPDVAALKRSVADQIVTFEKRATDGGADPEYVHSARYAMCSALDEAVLTTDWGAESSWSGQSLLSAFHNDVWGGEKVFEILDELKRDPKRTINLLELMAYLLALGFEGRYRVIEHGTGQLEEVRSELYQIIRRERGSPPRDLSEDWRGKSVGRGLRRFVPVWVVAACAAVGLSFAYIYFEAKFSEQLKPLFSRYDQIVADPLGDGPSPSSTSGATSSQSGGSAAGTGN